MEQIKEPKVIRNDYVFVKRDINGDIMVVHPHSHLGQILKAQRLAQENKKR